MDNKCGYPSCHKRPTKLTDIGIPMCGKHAARVDLINGPFLESFDAGIDDAIVHTPRLR